MIEDTVETVAMIKLPRAESLGDHSSESVFQASPRKALNAFLEGRATICPKQSRPPKELLELAAGFVEEHTLAGPSAISPKTLNKIEQWVLDGLHRKNMYLGSEILWIRSASHAVVHYRNLLARTFDGARDVFQALGATFQLQKENAGWKHLEVHLNEQTCADYGLEFESRRTLNPLSYPPEFEYTYRDIGADWLQFRERLADINRKLDDGFLKCLKEGRILVFQDMGDFRVAMLHPDRWQREPFVAQDHQNDHFLFTTDLPDTLMAKIEDPVLQQQTGIEVLNRICRELERRGERTTRSDLATVIQERFEISNNAFDKKIWPKANKRNVVQVGSPGKSPLISLNEIRKIE